MTDDNKPANRDGERRMSGYRGAAMIVLGAGLTIRYLNAGGEAWVFWLLFCAFFGTGAYFLFDAFRG